MIRVRSAAALCASLLVRGTALVAQGSAAKPNAAESPCATFPATADTSAEIVHLWVLRADPNGLPLGAHAGAQWNTTLGLVAQGLRVHFAPPTALPILVDRSTQFTHAWADSLRDFAVPDLGAHVEFTLHKDGRITDPKITDPSRAPVIDTLLVHGLERASGAPELRDLLVDVERDSARLVLKVTNKGPWDPSAPVAPFFRVLLPRYRFQEVVPSRKNLKPLYPPQFRQAHISGDVVLSFVVDSTGGVDLSTVQVVRTAYRQLVAAVVREMPRWRFQPATANGCPVRQRVEQTFNFTIGNP